MRVLEQGLGIRSDGEGSGPGAGRNQQRTGNRQADTRGAQAEGVFSNEAGLFTGKLTVGVCRGLSGVEGWSVDRKLTSEAYRG